MKIFIFLLLNILIAGYLKAQTLPDQTPCFMYDNCVITPNGTPVPTDDKNASKKILFLLGKQDYNLDTMENLSFGQADSYFNCHGFAWHMIGCQVYKSGSTYNYQNPKMGEAVWINRPNEGIYFSPEDESYIENIFDDTPIGAMVHYGSEDHTAVTTKIPGRYISKDGANPIIFHVGTKFANYDGEDTQIYIRTDYQDLYDFWEDEPAQMEIEGASSIVYGSSATYYVTSLPQGETVSWSASPSGSVNITISGNNATLSPNFNSNSSLILYATIAGTNEQLSKAIQITSSVPDLSIQGPSQVCSSGATFTLFPDPGSTAVSWQVSSNLSISGGNTNTSLLVYPSGTGNGTVSIYSNGNFIDSKTVWVGGPLQVSGVFPLNINGPNEFCSDQTYTLTVLDNNPAAANVTSYTWGVEGVILSGQGSSIIEAQFSSGSILSVRANNQCGGGNWLNIPYTLLPVYYCQGGGELFSMSPNPASETVTISFENPEEDLRTASTEEFSYTIRIYDQQLHFIKKIKCNTVDTNINISFLDRGKYYVQIEYKDALFAQELIVE